MIFNPIGNTGGIKESSILALAKNASGDNNLYINNLASGKYDQGDYENVITALPFLALTPSSADTGLLYSYAEFGPGNGTFYPDSPNNDQNFPIKYSYYYNALTLDYPSSLELNALFAIFRMTGDNVNCYCLAIYYVDRVRRVAYYNRIASSGYGGRLIDSDFNTANHSITWGITDATILENLRLLGIWQLNQ